MNCMEKLANIWQQNNSMVCVGLDPDLGKLPECVKNAEYPIFEFNKAIVDATAPYLKMRCSKRAICAILNSST